MLRTDILEKKEFILECIGKNLPKSFICRELKCKPDTLNYYLAKMDIEYKGNAPLKGFPNLKNLGNKVTAKEYSSNPNGVSSHTLKLKLIEEGIREYKCERCNNITWQDSPIPLELHHINGNRFDNNFSNLSILCPNCHSLENNKIIKYNTKKPENKDKLENKVSSKRKNYFCSSCSKSVSFKAKKCKSCTMKDRGTKIIWPPMEELIRMLNESNYFALGKKLGVSDNAIRKHIRNFVINS
jgi:hypothetical protein